MKQTPISLSKGFTIIEMIFVLVIISLLMAATMGLYGSYQKEQKRQLTEKNVTDAVRALEAYRVVNGNYPCPAPIFAQRSDSSYGKQTNCADVTTITAPGCATDRSYCVQVASEQESDPSPALQQPLVNGTVVSPNTRNAFLKANTGDPNSVRVRIGVLPFRDMNINETQSYDGYKSRIYYAVTERLAVPGKYSEENGAITVSDANDLGGTGMTNPPDSAKYVVFSVGPDRMGGVNMNAIFTGQSSVGAIPTTLPTTISEKSTSCNYDPRPVPYKQRFRAISKQADNCDFFYANVASPIFTTNAPGKKYASFATNFRGDIANTYNYDDVLVFDQSAGQADTGGWRAGDPNIVLNSVSESKNDLLLQGKSSVVIGTTSTRQTDAALHIAAAGDLRVEGKILTDQICDVSGACFKPSDLIYTCPLPGQYITGFGDDGDATNGTKRMYCNYVYFGCQPIGGAEYILQGRNATTYKPVCVPSSSISQAQTGTETSSGTSSGPTSSGTSSGTTSGTTSGASSSSSSSGSSGNSACAVATQTVLKNCDFSASNGCMGSNAPICAYHDQLASPPTRPFKQYSETSEKNCNISEDWVVTSDTMKKDCCFITDQYKPYRRIACDPANGACSLTYYNSLANANANVGGTSGPVTSDLRTLFKKDYNGNVYASSSTTPALGNSVSSAGGCGYLSDSGYIIQELRQSSTSCDPVWITRNASCTCNAVRYCATDESCGVGQIPDKCRWKLYNGGSAFNATYADGLTRCGQGATTLTGQAGGTCKDATYVWGLTNATATPITVNATDAANAIKKDDDCTSAGKAAEIGGAAAPTTACLVSDGGLWVKYNNCTCEKQVMTCSGANPDTITAPPPAPNPPAGLTRNAEPASCP